MLTEKTARGEFVDDCNRRAGKRGIAAGMPVSEARSMACHGKGTQRVPGPIFADHRRPSLRGGARMVPKKSGQSPGWLVIEPVRPEEDRARLVELAIELEQYSPCIGLEDAERPECLLMDITGVAHFFGGERPMAERLAAELSGRHFTVKIAIGDTVGAAWLAAHFLGCAERCNGKGDSPIFASQKLGQSPAKIGTVPSDQPAVIPPGQFDGFLAAPVEGLRLGETSLKKLHRLGINMISQILSLDRSSFLSRFGGEINLRLDQLTGKLPELIVPCRPAPKFEVEQFLEYGIKHPEAIERWWSSALKRLVGLLQPRQLGTRRICCQFITEKKTEHDILVRLCEPGADERHIGDLLRLKLEGLKLDAPLAGIRMEALETSPLERPQQELFAGRARNHYGRLPALLNRLCNRLGHEAVVRPRLLPDAVPERAVRFVPVTGEDSYGGQEYSPHGRQECPPSCGRQECPPSCGRQECPPSCGRQECPPSYGGPKGDSPIFASQKLGQSPGNWFLPLDRPACLLPQPRAVEAMSIVPDGPPCVLFWDGMRLEVARLWGPERIEAGWWQDFYVRRDYYRVETTDGRRFWIFRRLEDQQWFLHGESF